MIAFLDADDLLFPDYLERMGLALGHVPSAGLAFTDAWVLDHATGRVRRTSAMVNQNPPDRTPTDARTTLRELLRRNFVFFPTVRREALAAAGEWRESLTAAEDYELWLRIAAHGFTATPVAGRLAVHREIEGSNSSGLERQLRSMSEVYRIVAEEWDVDEETSALARERRQRTEALIHRYGSGRRSLREQVLKPARALRRAVRDRRTWLDAVPPDIARLLESTSA